MYFAIWGKSLGTGQGILNQYREVFRTSRVSLSRKIRPGMQHGTIGQHSSEYLQGLETKWEGLDGCNSNRGGAEVSISSV